MATKQRYINTASSAGGDGTTNATTGANRAFAGWAEFASYEGARDGAGDIYNVQVSGYENLGTTRLLYSGFASTVTLNFYAAAGEESKGLPSQGAGFTHSGTANHLWYYCAYTFTNLRFVATSTAFDFQFVAGAAVIPTWTNCYISKPVSFPHLASSARTLTFKNSVLAGGITLSAGEAAYKDTIKLVNSVVTARIVTYNYNTVDAKNSTFTAADWLLGAGTYTGATTNAVDCLFAEAYGASQFNGTYSGCTHSVNFSGYFADSANGDYNLTSSATLALDAGVGTSDGDVTANDANGVARGTTTCDIGPYELASASTDVSATQTVGAIVQSANAGLLADANAAQTIGAITQSAAVDRVAAASASQIMGDVVQSASAGLIADASAAQTVGDVAQAASAQLIAATSAAHQVGDIAQAVSAAVDSGIALEATQTVDSFSQSANAEAWVQALADHAITSFDSVAQAAAIVALSAAQEVNPFPQSAAIENIIHPSTQDNIGGGRRHDDDDELLRQVLDKWETIDAARAIDAARKTNPATHDGTVLVAVPAVVEQAVAAGAYHLPIPAHFISLERRPEGGAALLPDMALVARQARQRQDDEALLMILAEI